MVELFEERTNFCKLEHPTYLSNGKKKHVVEKYSLVKIIMIKRWGRRDSSNPKKFIYFTTGINQKCKERQKNKQYNQIRVSPLFTLGKGAHI